LRHRWLRSTERQRLRDSGINDNQECPAFPLTFKMMESAVMLCGTNLGGSPASVDADEAPPGLLSTRSQVTVRAQRIIRASLIALLSIVGAVPAFAEDTHRLSIECSHGSTADQRIASCSHLISLGYLDAKALVEAFHNRGNAYDDKGHMSALSITTIVPRDVV
jgi:hypothetical protein